MRYFLCVGLSYFFLTTIGCEVDQTFSPDATDVEDCLSACDQQRFFDCYEAADHAQCRNDCENATDVSAVRTFSACVRNADFCDAECSTHLEPTDNNPPPAEDNCVSACQAFVDDGCLRGTELDGIPCSSLCGALGTEQRFAVDYCANRRNVCELPDGCADTFDIDGSGDGRLEDCQDACSDLEFFGCISGTEQATCRDLCGTVSESIRDSFSACDDDPSCSADCYSVINPDGPAPDVGGCRSGCDMMMTFNCLTPAEHSECRSACALAERDPIETFKRCSNPASGGICDTGACFYVLRDSID